MTKNENDGQEILISYFDEMEFEKYGAIVCSEILIAPFYWINMFRDVNEILCVIAYVPVAIMVVLCFFIGNVVMTPVFFC